MLVHICCSVDSHFFLEKLQKDFPDEKLIGFFYDPNIHPYSEYQLRLLDVQRSCDMLGIDLLEGEYDFENWLEAVSGFEDESEKGKRCEICFDKRFDVASKKAQELKENKFTTTLLVSPLKSQQQLKKSGDVFYESHGVEFVSVDYRSGGGSQDQSRVTKENQLYRQDYCGCIYGLSKQRKQQNIFMDEMISSISKQIQPSSIEDRIELYKEREKLEKSNILYKIVTYKFLNYRQFNAKVERKKEIIPSYFLSYSTLKRKKADGRVEFEIDGIHYFNREEIKFISLEKFNYSLGKNYATIEELIFNAPTVYEEINLRKQLLDDRYSLSPIIVLEEIFEDKMSIYLDALTYEDKRDKILQL